MFVGERWGPLRRVKVWVGGWVGGAPEQRSSSSLPTHTRHTSQTDMHACADPTRATHSRALPYACQGGR